MVGTPARDSAPPSPLKPPLGVGMTTPARSSPVSRRLSSMISAVDKAGMSWYARPNGAYNKAACSSEIAVCAKITPFAPADLRSASAGTRMAHVAFMEDPRVGMEEHVRL